MNIKAEITVCMGSACFARGNARNLEFIESYLEKNNIKANVDLVGSRCDGSCADGPSLFLNGVKHTRIDEAKIIEILDSISVAV